MIRFECPRCKKLNQVSDKVRGNTTICEECGLQVAVRGPARDQPSEERNSPTPTQRRANDDKDRDAGDEVRPRERRVTASSVLGPKKKTFIPRIVLFRVVAVICAVVGVVSLFPCLLSLFTSSVPEEARIWAMFLLPASIGVLIWCLNVLTLKVMVHEGGLVHSHRGKTGRNDPSRHTRPPTCRG